MTLYLKNGDDVHLLVRDGGRLFILTMGGRRIGLLRRKMFRVDDLDGILVTNGYWDPDRFPSRPASLDLLDHSEGQDFEWAIVDALRDLNAGSLQEDDGNGAISSFLSQMRL